jgi:hypothetical protein
MKTKPTILKFIFVWIITLIAVAGINSFGEYANLLALQDICLSCVFFLSGFNMCLLFKELETQEKMKND